MSLTSLLRSNLLPKLPLTASKRFASTATTNTLLTWPKYLSLRKSQRRVGLLCSIPSTIAGLATGINYFASIEAEPTALILGLEPIYAYGIATMSCAGFGWLMGPVIGNSLWKLFNRRILNQYQVKEKDFYQHVVRNRVNPARQSVSNPVPDYYCEKPDSLSSYRQWMRDQSIFKRKAKFGDGEILD